MSEFCNIGPAERLARLERVLERANGEALNGIEYIEVLDQQMPEGLKKQQTLVVVCIGDIQQGAFNQDNVRISGGVRITDIGVVWVHGGMDFLAISPPSSPPSDIDSGEFLQIADVILQRFGTRLARVLVVRTDASGDFADYSLSLVQGKNDPSPPSSFDPMLASVTFSFKTECAHDFDCGQRRPCPVEERQAPVLDYLAKDYNSFRALILDRLSIIMPDWKERNPADLGITLAELLAYTGDQLSYYQDVVANEAYLGTSRMRISVRRHARLLDYRLHEGSNARTWVRVETKLGIGWEVIGERKMLLSRMPGLGDSAVVSKLQAEQAIAAGATVFETLEKVGVCSAHNEILFYLWGASSLVLRKGTTCATLRNTGNSLANLSEGQVIALVELRSFETGLTEDADPTKRHVVRLTKVARAEDPLFPEPGSATPQRLLNVEWDSADALPFDLCVGEWTQEVDGEPKLVATSVVWGNIVLADHGLTVEEPALTPVDRGVHAEAPLKKGPLTFQGQVTDSIGNKITFDPTAPASAALVWDSGQVMPCITMGKGDGEPWVPRFDLLESDPYDQAFVVETEDDGTARVRFGDGICGMRPPESLDATYRIGNGTAGNIGQGALAHIVLDGADFVANVSNVIPAVGGSDPEPIEHAILLAPHAFRTQERAVTEADYAAVTERHPEVQRAVATRRFIGSWDVYFIAVDRLGGKPVDAAFKQEIRQFIERFRLAGHDVEIEAPRLVPLDIVLPICVSRDHLRSQVLTQLEEAFSAFDLPGKRRGFFHPDNFTFGQPVYLSQIVAKAMSVPGVQAVLTNPSDVEFRFRRYLTLDPTAERTGILKIEMSEIACLANDLNQPMNGKIEFRLRGGL